MSFQLETTLAGYARAAVDLKARMWEFTDSATGRDYLQVFAEARRAGGPAGPERGPAPGGQGQRGGFLDTMHQVSCLPWRWGEPYVLAPAMTAIVAAAAQALDLTGEQLPRDAAPTDTGVLFLPEPVYHRRGDGTLASIGAITWATYHTPGTGRSSWAICSWADPTDPTATRAQLAAAPELAHRLGPYLLSDFDAVPIEETLTPRPHPTQPDEPDTEWQPAPDGRYCLTTGRTPACTALAYAFWRIQAQPLATTTPAALDRATRRRAQRASIAHTTRIVMLRRTRPGPTPLALPSPVRRPRPLAPHPRPQRQPHPHLDQRPPQRGPEDAPLLGGEKVAILAR